ncbi:MAG: DUF2330 domain-containing protein, partial [Verrucomicrobiota bacterium]
MAIGLFPPEHGAEEAPDVASRAGIILLFVLAFAYSCWFERVRPVLANSLDRGQTSWMKRSLLYLLIVAFLTGSLCADGLVRPPRNYAGSLEERSQEAIIVFQDGTETTSAKQDLILKIRVEGNAADFAWIVPLPNNPTTAKESAKLFEEVFNYVEARTRRSKKKGAKGADSVGEATVRNAVEVLSREVVGSYDVAVVRERESGALNGWLKEEGYQEIENGDRVIEHYRRKNYVFACIKVSEAKLAEETKAKRA